MSVVNKKICASIQTYSDNREILFQFRDLDKDLISFLNSFDKVYFAFHNCSDSYRTRMLQYDFFKLVHNLEVIIYNSISYPQTLLKTLLRCKEEHFNYFIFIQDDVFTYKQGNLEELIHIIKMTDYKFLALEVNNEELRIGKDRVITQFGETQLYRATSKDYIAQRMYACDDGMYVGEIDFLLENVYSNKYFQYDTVWNAENYMNDYITNNPIERFCTNYRSFKRYNMVGGNTMYKYNDLRFLNDKFHTSLHL